MESPYAGLVVGTVLFSTGCGLLEVLLSPLIHAVPSERKSADMALLHAFYPIGKVVVIVVSGVALWAGGSAWWPWITILWALVPLANTFAFAFLRLPPLGVGDQSHSLRKLATGRTLYLLLAAMMLAGAVELTLAQWASAYVQTGLGYPKLVADLVGFGLFGVGMIVGRLWFGLREGHIDLPRLLAVSCWCSIAVCGVLALSPWPWVALIACVLAGGAVSMLWPGVLSMSAARFPLAGAGLFALLAAAGDGGAGLMPWLAGMVADAAQGGLRTAFLVLALCPAAFLVVLWALRRDEKRRRKPLSKRSEGFFLKERRTRSAEAHARPMRWRFQRDSHCPPMSLSGSESAPLGFWTLAVASVRAYRTSSFQPPETGRLSGAAAAGSAGIAVKSPCTTSGAPFSSHSSKSLLAARTSCP